MFEALGRFGTRVFGIECTESDGPFTCQACNEQVILRSGEVRIPHFAHLPDSTCQMRHPESRAHILAKMNIALGLKRDEKCTDWKLERPIGDLRTDVYAVISGVPVAIEVQNSDITIADVKYKLEYYSNLGVHTLYVLPFGVPDGQLSLKAWQRYLHAMYRNTLFYWFDLHAVILIRLGMYKPPEGLRCTEEYYLQPRPVFRHPPALPLTNFAPMQRFSTETMNRHIGITDALLWNHQLGRWWPEDPVPLWARAKTSQRQTQEPNPTDKVDSTITEN